MSSCTICKHYMWKSRKCKIGYAPSVMDGKRCEYQETGEPEEPYEPDAARIISEADRITKIKERYKKVTGKNAQFDSDIILFLDDEINQYRDIIKRLEARLQNETYKKNTPNEIREAFGLPQQLTIPEMPTVNPPSDNINHPAHYNREGAMQSIDEMEKVFGTKSVMDFCLCNVWKYRYRSAHKNGIEDLKKSDWYMKKYLELKGKIDDSEY